MFFSAWLLATSGLLATMAQAAERRELMLHAWLDIRDGMRSSGPGINTQNQLVTKLLLRSPAVQFGQGPSSQIAYDEKGTGSRVQGSVVGSGSHHLSDKDASWTERFGMQAFWPNPVDPPDPGVVSMTMPELAKFGQGLDISIKLVLPLTGSASRVMVADGQTLRDHEALLAQAIGCTITSASTSLCRIELLLSPPLTGPRDPGAKEVYQRLKAADEVPGAADLAGLQGIIYKLDTQWQRDGHFIARAQAHYRTVVRHAGDSGALERDIKLVVWSSPRHADQTPPDVPPIKPPGE